MEIEVRPLREPEIPQAARVVDFAFRTNVGSIVRAPEVWRWRYWGMPGFDPRGAIAAVAGGRVVGTVMVTFRRLRLGRWVRFGVIDDVAALPGARGRGVARRMMAEALRFMEAEGAEATLLYADPRGVARNLYLDLGYRDIHLFRAWMRPLSSARLALREVRLLPLSLGLEVWSRLPVAGGSDGGPARDLAAYREALERGSLHLAGFPELGGGVWEWMRERNPTRPLPVAVGDPPRAGCTLCPLRVALFGSLEAPGAWMGDLFSVDGSNPVPAALRLARRRGLAFVIGLASERDRVRTGLLRRSGFLPFMGATMMVKTFTDVDLQADRPWHPMLESAAGLP